MESTVFVNTSTVMQLTYATSHDTNLYFFHIYTFIYTHKCVTDIRGNGVRTESVLRRCYLHGYANSGKAELSDVLFAIGMYIKLQWGRWGGVNRGGDTHSNTRQVPSISDQSTNTCNKSMQHVIHKQQYIQQSPN